MSYEDTAPNISQLVTEKQFKDSFPEPAAPAQPLPEPDAGTKMQLLIAYRDEYKAKGGAVALARLARRIRVPLYWAQLCDREVRATIAALYAPEPE